MKHIFLFLLAIVSISDFAHADFNDSALNEESSYIRPGPRPGPGRPEPYPDPGPRPGPHPHPGPGYPPPPPPPPRGPEYRFEHVYCSSYGYRYTECLFNPTGLQQIRIYQQHSYEPCIWGQTAGVNYNRIWVDRGCAATFEIIRYY